MRDARGFKAWLGGVVALVLVALAHSACSSSEDDCKGENGCACYPNGTCNTGLACADAKCSPVGGGFDLQACLACGDPACSSQAASCDSTAGCRNLLACVLACPDTNCKLACGNSASAGAAQAAVSYGGCAVAACPTACGVPMLGVGGAGGLGGSGSGAAPGTGGAISGGGGSGGSVAMRCTGTPAVNCAQCTAGGCNCSTVTGCVLASTGTCSGTPPACEQFLDPGECAQIGCEPNFSSGSCTGTAGACVFYTTQFECTRSTRLFAGGSFACTWTQTSECFGTPTPCAALSTASCTSTPGCTLTQ